MNPLPRVQQLWPLLMVADIQRSLAFYRDVLEFTVVDTANSETGLYWCRLEHGGVSLMLETADEAEAGTADGRGRGIIFYCVCDDARAIHARLAARGLELPAPSRAFYGMTQLYLTDPDGYALCFESPTPEG